MNQQEYNKKCTNLEVLIENTKDQPLLRRRHEAYMAQLQELQEEFGGSSIPAPLPPPASTPQLPSLGFFKLFQQRTLTLLGALPANWFFLLVVFAAIALVYFPLFLIMHLF